MFDPSPSQFRAIEADWQSTSEAVAEEESNAARAFELFRRTGDEGLLRTALAARQSAHDRMRHLMQRIWSRFGLNGRLSRARQAPAANRASEIR